MIRVITKDQAPPLGNVRAMGLGDVVYVDVSAHCRRDWGRCVDALASAVSRGASVVTTDIPAVPVVPFTKEAQA